MQPEMDHDRPELRARVKAELLYPTKPRLADERRTRIRELAARGQSIGFLSRMFRVTELDVYQVLMAEDDDASAG